MNRYYQLTEVTGADMPARYSINGRRVSKDRFRDVRDNADRLECVTTRGKQVGGGRIRRWNYTTAVYL